MSGQWDRCVSHRGGELQPFLETYFGSRQRHVLLIAGVGFDPRSATITRVLQSTSAHLDARFLREVRENPEEDLVDRANQHLADMRSLVPNSAVVPIDIFAQDGAIVGGRSAAQCIEASDLEGVTDIVVDCSAMSIGVSFPLIKRLLDLADGRTNLHLLITHNPTIDAAVVPIANDFCGPIHGFRGGLGLATSEAKAKLWLPQLALDQRAILSRIHVTVVPDDVCPILPFPSTNPRHSDGLIEHYEQEFESVWQVDARDIIYADENNPLDLYRTILKIGNMRTRVFEGVGGSLMVLSPLGSKVLAMGALMAAIELDLPVMYVEAVGYQVDLTAIDSFVRGRDEVLHIWLAGDVYPVSVNSTTARG